MFAFELTDLQSTREASGNLYHEFLRVASMSAGCITARLGKTIRRGRTTRTRCTCGVARGRDRIRVADEDRDAQTGSGVFVAAHAVHRFHLITEDMDILVFFASAEG